MLLRGGNCLLVIARIFSMTLASFVGAAKILKLRGVNFPVKCVGMVILSVREDNFKDDGLGCGRDCTCKFDFFFTNFMLGLELKYVSLQ